MMMESLSDFVNASNPYHHHSNPYHPSSNMFSPYASHAHHNQAFSGAVAAAQLDSATAGQGPGTPGTTLNLAGQSVSLPVGAGHPSSHMQTQHQQTFHQPSLTTSFGGHSPFTAAAAASSGTMSQNFFGSHHQSAAGASAYNASMTYPTLNHYNTTLGPFSRTNTFLPTAPTSAGSTALFSFSDHHSHHQNSLSSHPHHSSTVSNTGHHSTSGSFPSPQSSSNSARFASLDLPSDSSKVKRGKIHSSFSSFFSRSLLTASDRNNNNNKSVSRVYH